MIEIHSLSYIIIKRELKVRCFWLIGLSLRVKSYTDTLRYNSAHEKSYQKRDRSHQRRVHQAL